MFHALIRCHSNIRRQMHLSNVKHLLRTAWLTHTHTLEHWISNVVPIRWTELIARNCADDNKHSQYLIVRLQFSCSSSMSQNISYGFVDILVIALYINAVYLSIITAALAENMEIRWLWWHTIWWMMSLSHSHCFVLAHIKSSCVSAVSGSMILASVVHITIMESVATRARTPCNLNASSQPLKWYSMLGGIARKLQFEYIEDE